jgi:hypothetical protein
MIKYLSSANIRIARFSGKFSPTIQALDRVTPTEYSVMVLGSVEGRRLHTRQTPWLAQYRD